MRKKCAQSHSFGLGRVGGGEGTPLGGGGVGEPRTGIYRDHIYKGPLIFSGTPEH